MSAFQAPSNELHAASNGGDVLSQESAIGAPRRKRNFRNLKLPTATTPGLSAASSTPALHFSGTQGDVSTNQGDLSGQPRSIGSLSQLSNSNSSGYAFNQASAAVSQLGCQVIHAGSDAKFASHADMEGPLDVARLVATGAVAAAMSSLPPLNQSAPQQMLFSSRSPPEEGGAVGSFENVAARVNLLSYDRSKKSETSNLRASDLETIGELGHGNGGSVHLVRHRESGMLMAKKALLLEPSVFSNVALTASTSNSAQSLATLNQQQQQQQQQFAQNNIPCPVHGSLSASLASSGNGSGAKGVSFAPSACTCTCRSNNPLSSAQVVVPCDPYSGNNDVANFSMGGGGGSTYDTIDSEVLRKRVVRELQILHSCDSPYIITFYGAFVHDGEIAICMEHMDLGSLDSVYRVMAPVPEAVVTQVAVAVLEGLVYLYMNYRIVHRDVKPSNILFNSKGQFKICDFGVSGEAINSYVKTFVGTSAYMSPERIKGQAYSVQSDVWSLGLTLCEVAQGRYPFPPDGEERNLAIFELLDFIVNEDAPQLPPAWYSQALRDFVALCLIKDPLTRPTPSNLLLHPVILQAKASAGTGCLVPWAQEVAAAKELRARQREQSRSSHGHGVTDYMITTETDAAMQCHR